jgi:hypothetical protein
MLSTANNIIAAKIEKKCNLKKLLAGHKIVKILQCREKIIPVSFKKSIKKSSFMSRTESGENTRTCRPSTLKAFRISIKVPDRQDKRFSTASRRTPYTSLTTRKTITADFATVRNGEVNAAFLLQSVPRIVTIIN